ncbi:hypothetical protein ABIE44_003204 [Marmoricola sp. OAE513]|uniref:hypothetical protein n=1 Tax=Marmoricola sp. OAE513 TaxID=2817894 RepID=UPI001AEA58B3
MTDDQAHGFDFLHGSWRVDHRVLRERLAGCTDWDAFSSTAACTAILGGVGNLDQIELPHRSTTGATLRLYDAAADHWTLHWTTSGSGRLDPPMTGRFTDGVGTFLGTDRHDGAPIDVRFVWDEVTASSARWTQSFAPSGSGSWETNWVMVFSR